MADLFDIAVAKSLAGGGGGEATLINKNISANGTYNASADSADGYKKVVVDVPSVTPTGNINITDTSQTNVAAYATAQVVDADLVAANIKKDVNILGITGTYEGGGGSSWTLLHEEDIEASTTSTSETVVKTINVTGAYTEDLIAFIATDKAGARDGYLYRTIAILANAYAKSGSINTWSSIGTITIKKEGEAVWFGGSSARGVYVKQIGANDDVVIATKYNASSTGTIDGTYTVQVYKLSMPDGSSSPFA